METVWGQPQGWGETEKLKRMNLVTLRRRKPPLPHKVISFCNLNNFYSVKCGYVYTTHCIRNSKYQCETLLLYNVVY